MKYILILVSIFLLVIPVYGKNNSKKKHQKEYQQQKQSGQHKKYKKAKGYKKQQNLPSGLQKKVARGGDLPPGWQKKMRKGYRVEDAIYYHMKSCNRDTLRRLPRLLSGESYREIENDVVRLKNSSREILEVFKKNDLPLLPPPPPPPFFPFLK